MEKELMNEEMGTVMESVEIYDEPEFSSEGGFGKKLLAVGGTVIVGGATALAIKNRDKLKAKMTERKIKKLEKQGFVVARAEDVEYDIVDYGEEDVSEEE